MRDSRQVCQLLAARALEIQVLLSRYAIPTILALKIFLSKVRGPRAAHYNSTQTTSYWSHAVHCHVTETDQITVAAA